MKFYRTIVDHFEGLSAGRTDEEEVCGGDDGVVMQVWGLPKWRSRVASRGRNVVC